MALLGVLAVGLFSRAVWQMLPRSPLVRELERLPVPAGSELISIAALEDPVVPIRSARVSSRARHRNAQVSRANHWELLSSAPVLGRVCRALD